MPRFRRAKAKKDKFSSKQVTVLKGLIRSIELKKTDKSQTAGFYNDSTVKSLTSIVEGVASHACVGFKVKAHSIELRGVIDWAGSALGNVLARLLIVIDNQPDYQTVVITDVLATNAVGAAYSMFYPKRFSIVHDRVYAPAINNIKSIIIKRKLKQQMHYNAATADPDDRGKGNMYMFLVSDLPTNGGDGPQFTYRSRVLFSDL